MEQRSLQLRHVAKTLGIPLLYGSGALWLANKIGGKRRQIALNYHDVDAGIFRRHVMFLKRHATLVNLETFLAGSVVSETKPTVTITFDDGYASFVDEIIPILSAFDVPATWFVPTALIGSDEIFWFDRVRAQITHSRRDGFEFQGRQWKLLAWNRPYIAAAVSRFLKTQASDARDVSIANITAQLEEVPVGSLNRFRSVSPPQLQSIDLARVTIGSHSHTHPQMSQLSGESLSKELVLSRQLLEKWIRHPVRHFAFPSGDYDGRTIRAVRDAGYLSAWTTEPRFRVATDDPYRMPRIFIDDRAPVSVLAAKMTLDAEGWGIRA